MKKFLIIFTIVPLWLWPISSAFAFETEKTLTLPADGLRQLRIDCGSGRLRIAGVDSNTIEVKAEIYVRGVSEKKMNDYIKDHIELSLERRGDEAVLNSRIENRGGLFFFGDAGINLTVRVPKNLSLNVEDGSGSILIEDIGGRCSLEDGSGGIRLDRVAGDVVIEDDSGEILLRDIGGNVSLEDGSGAIEVERVKGSVTIDDGSGSIAITDIGKDVIIEEAGSGDVHIDNVKGRVIRHDLDDDDDDDDDEDDDEDP